MANQKTLLFRTTDLSSILDLAKQGVFRMELEGHNVSIRRMECFAVKGVRCVRCGIVGNAIVLEQWKDGSLHVDLYHEFSGQGRRLMTIDHIKPKSKGGANTLDNYQPMCYTCNQKKSDTYEPVLCSAPTPQPQ